MNKLDILKSRILNETRQMLLDGEEAFLGCDMDGFDPDVIYIVTVPGPYGDPFDVIEEVPFYEFL